MEQVMEELARYLRGWRGYFGFCETPWVLQRLDSWVRRRVRCAFWRQWKTDRKRFAELVRRGVREELAANTAGSRGGPWHVSQSPALDIALSNAALASLGLLSLVEGR
jgi:RNA-directed DNA polymerase